jgi:hypothetical protein
MSLKLSGNSNRRLRAGMRSEPNIGDCNMSKRVGSATDCVQMDASYIPLQFRRIQPNTSDSRHHPAMTRRPYEPALERPLRQACGIAPAAAKPLGLFHPGLP